MMEKSKQVIVVRKDLNMRKGKIASQVAHASFKVFLDLCYRKEYKDDWYEDKKQLTFIYNPNSAWDDWLNDKFTKVVCSCKSEEELMDLYQQAKSSNLPCSLIVDSGFTEFHGVPTKTCISIGPDFPEKIDKITGHLDLL